MCSKYALKSFRTGENGTILIPYLHLIISGVSVEQKEVDIDDLPEPTPLELYIHEYGMSVLNPAFLLESEFRKAGEEYNLSVGSAIEETVVVQSGFGNTYDNKTGNRVLVSIADKNYTGIASVTLNHVSGVPSILDVEFIAGEANFVNPTNSPVIGVPNITLKAVSGGTNIYTHILALVKLN